jgi:RNA polymerase sigma-70 factor (ECF subfamily)
MAVAADCGTTEATILDEELIARVVGGERGAFDLLYERYFPRVCGYVRRRIGNPADVDEAVQEVFVNVFTSLESFRAEAPFAAWVLGVARRTVAGRFKKQRVATVSLDDYPAEEIGHERAVKRLSGPTPLEEYECNERVARMEAVARQKLTPEQRSLVEMHHLQDHSIREIAHILARSEDAVKSNLYRARKLLQAS